MTDFHRANTIFVIRISNTADLTQSRCTNTIVIIGILNTINSTQPHSQHRFQSIELAS